MYEQRVNCGSKLYGEHVTFTLSSLVAATTIRRGLIMFKHTDGIGLNRRYSDNVPYLMWLLSVDVGCNYY